MNSQMTHDPHTHDAKMTQLGSLPHYDTGHAADRLALIEAEAAWEMAGVTRGIERYRAIAATREVDERYDSQAIVRRMVPPLVERIAAAQAAEGLRVATKQDARLPVADSLLLVLPPEDQAVITLACVFRGIVGCADGYNVGDARLTQTALVIAGAALDQAEFKRWTEQQRAILKADPETDDLVKRLAYRYPDMKQDVWRRVRRRLDVARATPMTEGDRVQYGAALIAYMVEVADGAVTQETVKIGSGRTEARIVASECLIDELNDRRVRAEVARPLLLPMISPPNPWRYE